jgi:hypothetical protein
MLLARVQTQRAEDGVLQDAALAKAEELGAHHETLCAVARAAAVQELGRDEDAYFRAIVDQAAADRQPSGDKNGRACKGEDVLSIIDSLMFCAAHDARREEGHFASLQGKLTERMSLRAQKLANQLRQWVLAS